MTSAFRTRDWADDMPPIRTLKGHVDHLAHRVLQHLARRAKPDGTDAYPAVQTLAIRLGVERREVRRALETLEKAGLIVDCGESDYGTTIWHLQVDDPGPIERLQMLNQERALTLAQGNAERQARFRARKRNGEEPVSNAPTAVTRNGEDPVTSQRGARYVTPSTPLRNAASDPRTDPVEQIQVEQTRIEQTPALSDPAPEEAPVALLNLNDFEDLPAAPPKPRRQRTSPATEDPDFDKAWAAYGHKVDRVQAMKAWTRARKKASAETILAAIPAYVAVTTGKGEPEGTGTAWKPRRKNLATWLNNEGWTEEIEAPKKGYQGQAGSDVKTLEGALDRAKVRPICKLMRTGPMPGDWELNFAWYYHWNLHEQRDWTVEQMLETGNSPEDVDALMDAYANGIDPQLYERLLADFNIPPHGSDA